MTYLSTNDRTKNIRKALKAKGWNSRKISVRKDEYSMGASIYVTIKDAQISLAIVKEIAENLGQRIDRCTTTGDISSGGNTYVTVSYDDEALKPLADMIQTTFPVSFGKGTEVEAFGYRMTVERGDIEIWKTDANGTGSRVAGIWGQASLSDVAMHMARIVASAGALGGAE